MVTARDQSSSGSSPQRRTATQPTGRGRAAQHERRERILDATIALAAQGGYDAVQMRTVAENADVALGTLYRYFPSKIHLLVCGLERELDVAHQRIQRAPVPGTTPAERLNFVLARLTRALQRSPEVTEAMTRAFMFADASAATEVDQVGRLIEEMFSRAMAPGEPITPERRAIVRVISDVWMSNLMAWVTRRASVADVTARLELTTQLLLGGEAHAEAS